MEHIKDTLTFAAEVGDFVTVRTWDGRTLAGYVARSTIDDEVYTIGLPGVWHAQRIHVADVEEVTFD